MATASPFDSFSPPASDRAAVQGGRLQLGRAYAEHLLATQPEEFARLGVTVEQYATEFAESGLTIDESVAAGYMSAAEGRFIQFCATREDLIELGHTPEEIEEILEEQRQRACASSS